MEFLYIFSRSVCRMLFLVCSASQRYIHSLETLKPVVTSFKFFGLFLSEGHPDFLLHIRFNPQLGDFTSFARLSLNSATRGFVAHGYLSLFLAFSPSIYLLCHDSLTPPVLALSLLSDISANILSLALFHLYNETLAYLLHFCHFLPFIPGIAQRV